MRKRWRKTDWPSNGAELTARVASIALPLQGPDDLNPLLARIGNARYVLLGEASHGTAEYYTWRAAISQRLILEKNFSFIAVEGDWPDCYRVNRFVRGLPAADDGGHEALHSFERWPTWMWANQEVVELAGWLRQHNDGQPSGRRVGFYGLDVYSLWDSLFQVMGYLHKSRPRALDAARRAFRCFEPYDEDVQDYARATRWLDESCENEVVTLLAELRRAARPFPGDGREAHLAPSKMPWSSRTPSTTTARWSVAMPNRGTSATATCTRR